MSQEASLISLEEAKQLTLHLEAGEVDAANGIIHSIMLKESDELFSEVGKLTRQVHDSLSSFQLDFRLEGLTNTDMPDARSRLEYVITETEKAANSTMDAVEQTMPIAEQLNQRLLTIMPEWKKLMTRQIELGEFKHLCLTLDKLLADVASDSKTLNIMLTEVLLAQGYQDITGQIIRRVIEMLKEVEDHLIAILASSNEHVARKDSSQKAAATEDKIEAEGPIINPTKRDDVVNNQDDVDDLLSSLGF